MTVITHYKLLPAQYEFLFGLDKGRINDKDTLLDVALYQGGFTCVPSDTEYLSPTGWKRIDTLTKDDKLAVYYDNGEIKYEHPLEVFKWDADKWYEFHTRTLWQKVCPNHKMVTWSSDNKKRTQSMVEYYNEHERLKQGHSGRFKTTFTIDGISSGFTENELRFLIAYQADGYVYNESTWTCAFHLCKKRKYNRLLQLCADLNFKYKKGVLESGDYRLYVEAPERLLIKVFPREWYSLSSKELSIIVDEIPHWDGSIGKHNCYYTSTKENADFVQFAGSAVGYRSTIFTRTRPSASGSGKLVTEYRVNFNTNTMPSLQATRNKARITVTKAKGGEAKYCPSTTTGMWLARYKNYIFVTGNS